MKRTDIIKLCHAIYTSVDTSEEENWQAIWWAIRDVIHRQWATPFGRTYTFLDTLNCKHYENLNNFTELFNEHFPG